jgi:Protein of unknown function (DUF3102)
MPKQPSTELVVVGFIYDLLDAQVAEQVRSSADRIRERLKKTLEDIIEIGNDLMAVREALDHGQFLNWLRAEFGWQQRTAYNFISVAERFKLATIASLPIDPTAAYLLAAPSIPEEARQLAIERAEGGEKITTVIAKEIVAEARKKARPRKPKKVSTEKLGLRLANVLERYKKRWDTKELSEMARQLREFADELEGHQGGRKRGKE